MRPSHERVRTAWNMRTSAAGCVFSSWRIFYDTTRPILDPRKRALAQYRNGTTHLDKRTHASCLLPEPPPPVRCVWPPTLGLGLELAGSLGQFACNRYSGYRIRLLPAGPGAARLFSILACPSH